MKLHAFAQSVMARSAPVFLAARGECAAGWSCPCGRWGPGEEAQGIPPIPHSPQCLWTAAREALGQTKYAIAHPADQTIAYVASYEDGKVSTTIKHPEVKLYDDLIEASGIASDLSIRQALFLKNGGHDGKQTYSEDFILRVTTHWVETVEDEAEFRAREDTW